MKHNKRTSGLWNMRFQEGRRVVLRKIDFLLKTFADRFDLVACMETSFRVSEQTCASLNRRRNRKITKAESSWKLALNLELQIVVQPRSFWCVTEKLRCTEDQGAAAVRHWVNETTSLETSEGEAGQEEPCLQQVGEIGTWSHYAAESKVQLCDKLSATVNKPGSNVEPADKKFRQAIDNCKIWTMALHNARWVLHANFAWTRFLLPRIALQTRKRKKRNRSANVLLQDVECSKRQFQTDFPDVLKRHERSLNYPWKLVMNVEKHLAALEYFLASLNIFEQL